MTVGFKRCVHDLLDRIRLAAAPVAFRGDHQLRLRIVNARAQRIRGESSEHDRVDRAEAGGSQHRNHGLRDHRHVHCDAVAGTHTQLAERVGGLLYGGGEFGVRVGCGGSGFVFEVDGDAVAVAGLDVAVECVVGGVEFAVFKPLIERRFGVVEDRGEVFGPRESFAGTLRPIAEAVLLRAFVEVLVGDGVLDELGARRE